MSRELENDTVINYGYYFDSVLDQLKIDDRTARDLRERVEGLKSRDDFNKLVEYIDRELKITDPIFFGERYSQTDIINKLGKL